ncbi:MAG: hypothetical protein Q8P41_08800 [Pseudomonadota bacterium]|nr:hypothetical protein [Pseudomonadota bacterium]
MLLVLLMGCSVYDKLFDLLEEPPTSPCETRTAWWEDVDGDGAGNPAEVWVSCEQPDGWVAAAGDCDDADAAITAGCADTGAPDTGAPDTGDTAPADTDTAPADTDTADTDTAPADTDTADTEAATAPRSALGPALAPAGPASPRADAASRG